VAGQGNGQLMVFDLRQPSFPLQRPQRVDVQPIHSLHFMPKSNCFVSASLSGIRSWTLTDFQPTSLAFPSHCCSLSVDATNSLLLASFKMLPTYSKSAHVVSALLDQPHIHVKELRTLFASSINSRIARSAFLSSRGYEIIGVACPDTTYGQLEIWNISTGAKLKQMKLESLSPLDTVSYEAGQGHNFAFVTQNRLSCYAVHL